MIVFAAANERAQGWQVDVYLDDDTRWRHKRIFTKPQTTLLLSRLAGNRQIDRTHWTKMED